MSKAIKATLVALAVMTGAVSSSADRLQFLEDADAGILTVQEGTTAVLSYRFALQSREGIDPKYTRACYIHPLYSLDGEPLTDDFPEDHLHHRGVFWSWPMVETGGVKSQTWHPATPSLRQHFVRWVKRDAGDDAAVFASENRWLLDEKKDVARELVTVRVYPADGDSRNVDIEVILEAVGAPLKLQGEQSGKKGYGGLCLRAAPSLKGAPLVTVSGPMGEDVVNEPYPWVDLANDTGGVAIFVSPDHPGFPPPWLARNSYAGFLNPQWPGLPSVVINPGEPVTLRYRIHIHRGNTKSAELEKAYEAYKAAVK